MAKIIGDLGSEKALVRELKNVGIFSLQNLDEIELHISHSDVNLKKYIEEEQVKLRNEIEDLKLKHGRAIQERESKRFELQTALTAKKELFRNVLIELANNKKHFLIRIVHTFQYWITSQKLRSLEKNFDKEIEKPLLNLSNEIKKLVEEFENYERNFDNLINTRVSPAVSDKEKIDKTLERFVTHLIGARGEKTVVQALSKLPDSHFIINDVTLSFKPPLRTDKGLRFKCQADHVVVSPAGVFNIETKYWSQKSVRNMDLSSPVEQIKITGSGLWRELNAAIRTRKIKLNRHHWGGDPKINVRNILVMVGAAPHADFQMVKLMAPSRLAGYIDFFKPALQNDEVESIASWIINEQNK